MEALAALSIACNVFQVISFTRETISVARSIHRSGTPDQTLSDRATQLKTLSAQLQNSIQNTTPVLQQTGTVHAELLTLAQKCSTASADILSELSSIASSRAGTACKLVKTLLRRRSLDKLWQAMQQYERVLLSRLLADVWDKQAAATIQLQSGFAGLDSGLKDCIQNFEQGRIQTEELLRRDMLVSLTANVNTLRQLIASGNAESRSHITASHQTLQDKQAAEARLGKFRQSLWFEDINCRPNQIEKSHEATFDWVFESDRSGGHNNLMEWLLTGNGLFWVNGKPGSGKSCFMKFLVHERRTAELLPSHAIYSYFLWNSSNNPMQRNRRGMFCSLLHQMLAANDSYAAQLLQECPGLSFKQHHSDWELEELETTLQSTFKLHTQPVCLFIDGLDELDEQGDNYDLVRLVKTTFLSSSSPSGLKICVSSRPEPLWVSLLGGFPSIKLQDLTRKDHEIVATKLLKNYCQEVIQDQDEYQIQQLVDLLVDKAEGVFLWLRLVLKSLQRGLTGKDSFHELKERIDDLPSDLISFYKTMLGRLGDDETKWKHEAAMYFHIVLQWPNNDVSLDSFFLAVASDAEFRTSVFHAQDQAFSETKERLFLGKPEIMENCFKVQTRVESRCAGLLEYTSLGEHDTWRGIVRLRENLWQRHNLRVGFIHRTAREFLLDNIEGRQLLECYPKTDAVENIIRTFICTASLQQCSQSFSDGSLSSEKDLPYQFKLHCLDINMAIRLFLKLYGNWTRTPGCNYQSLSPADMIKLNKEASEKLSLTSLYEEIAAADCPGLILQLPELGVRQCKLSGPLLSYLTESRMRGVQSPTHVNETKRLMAADQFDARWGSIHTIALIAQGIPQLLEYDETSLLQLMGQTYQIRVSEFTVKSSASIHRRILSSLFPKSFHLSPPYHTGIAVPKLEPCRSGNGFQESDWPAADIVIERNIAQLFNEAYLYLQHPWRDMTFHEIGDTNALLESMRTRLYPAELCHRKVILVGGFSVDPEKKTGPSLSGTFRMSKDQKIGTDFSVEQPGLQGFSTEERKVYDFFKPSNGQYCVPTEDQSNAILEIVDQIPIPELYHWKSPDTELARQLQGIVDDILTTNLDRVTDIAQHLRQTGFYIPTEESIWAFQEAKDALDRVDILQKLNQERLEMERNWHRNHRELQSPGVEFTV